MDTCTVTSNQPNNIKTKQIMTITELQYQTALKKLAFHEAKVEEYKAITRKFHYDNEAERVKQRKTDSDKYHRENPRL